MSLVQTESADDSDGLHASKRLVDLLEQRSAFKGKVLLQRDYDSIAVFVVTEVLWIKDDVVGVSRWLDNEQ